MRGIPSAVLLVIGTFVQACQRDDTTAPQLDENAATAQGRAPARLSFTTQPPAGVAAGEAISPAVQVTVTDDSGAAVAGGEVKIALGPTTGAAATLSGTVKAKLVRGVATFSDLQVDQPGRGYTLVATAGPASGTSSAFAVVGPPTQLAFVTPPPASVEGTVAMAPAVRVAIQDALGSTVPGATQPVTLTLGTNPSGGALAGTTTVQAVDGIATFADLSVDRPERSYTLAAAAPGLTPATSTEFAVHLTFTTLDAGGNSNDAWDPPVTNTCGVTTAGAAYCWGSNTRAKLGNGIPWDGSARPTTSPVLVAGGLRFASVSVGEYYVCGLTTNGAAYCWGQAFGGPPQATPVLFSGGLTFHTLSAGNAHACGVITGGAAHCWGFNGTGELGDGTTTTSSRPSAPVAGGLTWAAVNAGYFRTCGVTTSSAAYCWGQGATTPAPVADGFSFTTITSGPGHTCGVATTGTAYCWGVNRFGELGDGTTIDHANPAPVAGGLTFRTIDAEYLHTCGVTTNGTAYCWGWNGRGQLGDGTTTTQTSPVPVAGGLTFSVVSVGQTHTCGVATGGAAYCWGMNNYGQLGNGTTTSSLTPVQVVQ
jgi:hypothetical protein